MHSRASAHLFEGEDAIEFDDVFEGKQEEDVSTGSIEGLLHSDSQPTSVLGIALPQDELLGFVEENINLFENAPSRIPVVQPKGTNGRPLVFTETKTDELPYYSFHFELTQFSEQSEQGRAFCVGVSVRYFSTVIGQLNALLIDRDAISETPFHSVCSQDEYVGNVVSNVCDAHGMVRYGSVDTFTTSCHKAASRRGLLVLKSIMVDHFHRHEDVGIRCVWALLQWLNMDAAAFTSKLSVSSVWTLALVAPLGQQGIQFTLDDRDRMLASNRVAQQFRRIGFQQTQRGSHAMFVIPARLRRLPKPTTELFPSASLPDSFFGPVSN